MIAAIDRIVRATKASLLIGKAQDRVSQGKWAEALECLRSVYEILGSGTPSRRATYEMNILCGNIAATVGEYDLAVAATTIALDQLESAPTRWLSQYDKEYLKYCCANIFRFCAARMQPGAIRSDLLSSAPTYRSLRVDKVKSHIRRNFPLRKPDAINSD